MFNICHRIASPYLKLLWQNDQFLVTTFDSDCDRLGFPRKILRVLNFSQTNTTNILQLIEFSPKSLKFKKKELRPKKFKRFANLNGITLCPYCISEATRNFTVQDPLQVLHSVTEIWSP